MLISEIISQVKTLSENDLSIPDADITQWVDFAIDRINIALSTTIPHIKGVATSQSPQFDARYHESLVMFAVGKYREGDASYSDAQYFLGQFNDMLMQMQRDMVIQPSIRTDYNIQQIVVTSAAVFAYTLTMPYGSYFDDVVVYKNDAEVDSKLYSFSIDNRTITFKGLTLAVNDKITIKFENNSDLNAPPYQWWGQSGW